MILTIFLSCLGIIVFNQWNQNRNIFVEAKKNPNLYASPYIYVFDREKEKEIYKKNDQERTYPASLTKMMTVFVALEEIKDLDTLAPIDVGVYHKMINNNGSMAGFYGNEQVTVRDLLYGTVLNSGGEAAGTLAIHVAGSKKAFVQLMNKKAAEIGMDQTYFSNVEGLHDKKHYTTARDIAKLLDVALENKRFRAILTKPTFQTTATLDHPEGISLKSTVLSRIAEEKQKGFKIIGGKSGTTYEAGQCWATVGNVNSKEYIVVTMGAPFQDISDLDEVQIADTVQIYQTIYSKSH